jgi:hypothetical protein
LLEEALKKKKRRRLLPKPGRTTPGNPGPDPSTRHMLPSFIPHSRNDDDDDDALGMSHA